jgi:hypothetical protein
MNEEEENFKAWLADCLHDEAITIGGVHLFGGTMWTDFNGGDVLADE